MAPAERKPWSAIKRGTEAAFSLVLALLCFVAILAILGLSFPKGMGLRDVILPGDVATTGDGLAAREVDIGDAVLADVAVLYGKTRKVKNKAADAIAWGDARVGMGLAGGHAIQTFQGSEATISFGEGSVLTLGENSLVVLKSFTGQADGTNREVSLVILGGEVHGSITGEAADEVRVRVETTSGDTEVRTRKETEGPTRFRVAVDEKTQAATLSIEDGAADISSGGETLLLEAGQVVEVRPDAALGAPVTLLGAPVLLTPEPGTIRTYRTLPPRLRFRWQPVPGADDYVFAMATDADFQDLVFEEARRGSSFDFGTLVAGEYYWRVSSRRDGVVGHPGPSHRLRVLQDRNPPSLQVEWPGGVVPAATAVIRGRAEPGARVFVADQEVGVGEAGEFSHEIALTRGTNVIVVEAVDPAGNTAYASGMIESDTNRTE